MKAWITAIRMTAALVVSTPDMLTATIHRAAGKNDIAADAVNRIDARIKRWAPQ